MNTENTNIPEDLSRALEGCIKTCNTILDNFAIKLTDISAPNTIYHYTDCSGLLGILDSGKIRMTDIFGLNDKSEIRHGLNIAQEVLESKLQLTHKLKYFIIEGINNFKENGLAESASIFVACFSNNPDDLGQWRAYGNDGCGFTLGFDGKLLDKTFSYQDDELIPGNSTFPITYNDDKLRDIYIELIREIIPLIELPIEKELNENTIFEFYKKLLIQLAVLITYPATFFKHQAYKNEDEFRFLKVFEMNNQSYRPNYIARRNKLVSFIELDWKSIDQNILREILIGPAADVSSARTFVVDCLLACGFDTNNVRIHQSRIPYRNT